jgi:hypothetical protein
MKGSAALNREADAGDRLRGLRAGDWVPSINVRDFIVRKVSPYAGKEDFLATPSQRTKAQKMCGQKRQPSFTEERKERVVAVAAQTPSTLRTHKADHIDRDNEVIVGLQRASPLSGRSVSADPGECASLNRQIKLDLDQAGSASEMNPVESRVSAEKHTVDCQGDSHRLAYMALLLCRYVQPTGCQTRICPWVRGATIEQFFATVGKDQLEINVAPWGEGQLKVNGLEIARTAKAKDPRQAFTSLKHAISPGPLATRAASSPSLTSYLKKPRLKRRRAA